MTHTTGPSQFLDLTGIDQLPLWAQVTLAARIARRMALGWRDLTDAQREPLLRACDRMLAAATSGVCTAEDRATFAFAFDHATALKADALALTLFYAGDAAFAAMRADETSWGDSTAVASVRKSLQAACSAAQFGPLQVRITAAADADLLAFACGEDRLTRLSVMTPHVFGRLAPTHALNPAFEEPINPEDLYR
ncbi:MAG TPA: hypothetical protein VK157_10265 [Phycisphaerales bacterium]|nr:hypothetical protein [Phycisphaerales bacterium]